MALNNANVSSSRILILHFEDSEIRLKYFSQTSREDLMTSIREILDVEATAPLRFRDNEGNIVAISPHGLPSDTELHVKVEGGPPAKVRRIGESINSASVPIPIPPSTVVGPWVRWDNCQGKLSEIYSDSMKFSVPGDECESWSVYTPTFPTAGRHYFTIDFAKKRQCCISIGLIPASTVTVHHSSHLIRDNRYPFLISLMGLGSGPKKSSSNKNFWYRSYKNWSLRRC
mmetsp:Transcript_7877/g.11157  ORF Transcript_7877/g.11157 Transcript_7877/m.11157 type:complete len:229 (+) Transcript_7877:1272-1958(+)